MEKDWETLSQKVGRGKRDSAEITIAIIAIFTSM
jgi:hypothetical protein